MKTIRFYVSIPFFVLMVVCTGAAVCLAVVAGMAFQACGQICPDREWL